MALSSPPTCLGTLVKVENHDSTLSDGFIHKHSFWDFERYVCLLILSLQTNCAAKIYANPITARMIAKAFCSVSSASVLHQLQFAMLLCVPVWRRKEETVLKSSSGFHDATCTCTSSKASLDASKQVATYMLYLATSARTAGSLCRIAIVPQIFNVLTL